MPESLVLPINQAFTATESALLDAKRKPKVGKMHVLTVGDGPIPFEIFFYDGPEGATSLTNVRKLGSQIILTGKITRDSVKPLLFSNLGGTEIQDALGDYGYSGNLSLMTDEAVAEFNSGADREIFWEVVVDGIRRHQWRGFLRPRVWTGDEPDPTPALEGLMQDVIDQAAEATAAANAAAAASADKADKITGGTTDNLVKRDAGGNIADSGVAVSTDGTLAANSDAKLPTEKAVKTYADTKATKVPTPTNDNIVLTDAGGNLKDSGESKLVLAQATTTQRGTSRRATSAEVIAGTDDLAHVTSAGIAAAYAKRAGPAHIIPVVTSDNAQNGANFLAAYAAAAALTPGGAPLSATNRACVLLLPGTYDWSATALPFVPSDNVDIAGISGNRDDVQLEGPWATGITCNYNVSNVTGGDYAFHVDSTLTGVFRNCKGGNFSFAASDMGGGTFSGTAIDCVGGVSSFGGYGNTFSGTATNCTGGDYSFGGYGTFAGTATNCTGGNYSFGSGGAFSGTATGCTGGSYSFGAYGTFSGTATDCTGGDYSFGSNDVGGSTFSGTATGCVGGEGSFGGYGNFSGTATNCTGGDYSFGGYGTFSGTATGCTGGHSSFGSGGTFSGTATDCVGGDYSFGGYGNFSGTATITGCVGGTNSFGGGGDFSGATSVLFKDCRLTTGSFADPGDTDVKIRRCLNADLSEANFN